MKKLFYSLVIATLCCLSVACNKDDNGNSGLVGTWNYSNVYLILNPNGTGSQVLDFSSSGQGQSISNFTWNQTNSMIHLNHDGLGNMSAGIRSYYYTLNSNILELWYDDGDFFGAFTRTSLKEFNY